MEISGIDSPTVSVNIKTDAVDLCLISDSLAALTRAVATAKMASSSSGRVAQGEVIVDVSCRPLTKESQLILTAVRGWRFVHQESVHISCFLFILGGFGSWKALT